MCPKVKTGKKGEKKGKKKRKKVIEAEREVHLIDGII